MIILPSECTITTIHTCSHSCSHTQIHTPDSSRYWISDTFAERHAQGLEPENIDKEFLRLWFRSVCDPYKDEVRSCPI